MAVVVKPDYTVALYAGDTEIVTIAMTHGDAGSNILLSEVSTAVFTLKDVQAGSVVNSRNAQNVLNANNFTIANGSIEWKVQTADTNIVTSGAQREVHRGEFILTLTDSQRKMFVIDLVIRQQGIP